MNMNKLEYYTAPWCGPCRVMADTVKAVAKSKKMELTEYDVEASPDHAIDRMVTTIPQLVLTDGEGVLARWIGIHKAKDIKAGL